MYSATPVEPHNHPRGRKEFDTTLSITVSWFLCGWCPGGRVPRGGGTQGRGYPGEGSPREGSTQAFGSPQHSRHRAFSSCLLCFQLRAHYGLLSRMTWLQFLNNGALSKLSCGDTVGIEPAGRTLWGGIMSPGRAVGTWLTASDPGGRCHVTELRTVHTELLSEHV